MFGALDDRMVSTIMAALPFDTCILLSVNPINRQLHRSAGDAIVRRLVTCPALGLARLCEALCRQRAISERVFLSLQASDFSATCWQILLCNAAAYGLTRAVICAISRGTDLSALLHVAARGGHYALAVALLGRGADPNESRPKSGSTPLHEAALSRGPTPMVQLLLDSKSDANATERGKNTPLHMAAVGGHICGIAALIAAGANPNLQNSIGSTPLHVAVYNGNLRNCGALLAAGADRGTTDIYGKTPLDRAIQYRYPAIVDLLRADSPAVPARG